MIRPRRRENELLAKYLKFARPTLDGLGLCFKHADQSKGVPDLSWTANQYSSWWEAKHDVGEGIDLAGSMLQFTNMRRLEVAGHCARYIVWAEYSGEKSIHIVRPSAVQEDGSYVPGHSCNGWHNEFILRAMRNAHRV